MPDVDAKDLLQVARPRTRSRSRHSARTVRTHRSAYAFALGACTGANSTSAPLSLNPPVQGLCGGWRAG